MWPVWGGSHRGKDAGVQVDEACAGREFEFLEWTADDHLRLSRFVAIRKGRKPKEVLRK
jgi:hypothetical protein